MKKCYSCGAEMPDSAKFCPKCGKPAGTTGNPIVREKSFDSTGRAAAEPAGKSDVRPADQASTGKSEKGVSPIVIAVILVIIAVIASAAATVALVREDADQTAEYDKNGNVIRETWDSGCPGGDLRYEYTYDDDGDLLTETQASCDFMISYTYDSDGNVLCTTNYDHDGTTILRWTECTYDDAGNKLSETYYDGDGAIISQYIYAGTGELPAETDFVGSEQ